jgi:hypothetical protein
LRAIDGIIRDAISKDDWTFIMTAQFQEFLQSQVKN